MRNPTKSYSPFTNNSKNENNNNEKRRNTPTITESHFQQFPLDSWNCMQNVVVSCFGKKKLFSISFMLCVCVCVFRRYCCISLYISSYCCCCCCCYLHLHHRITSFGLLHSFSSPLTRSLARIVVVPFFFLLKILVYIKINK